MLYEVITTTSGVWIKEGNDFVSVGALFRDGSLRDLNLYRFDTTGHLKQIIRAPIAFFNQGVWQLEKASFVDLQDKKQLKINVLKKWGWKTNLTPDKLGIAAVDPNELSAKGLYNYIEYMKSNGQNADDYELEFWRKVLAPLSVIAMMLLAASTIFGPLRSVSMGARLISGVLIGFSFYVVNQVFGPFSLVYKVPPIFGAIIPSLIFMGFAIYLLAKRRT